MKSIDGAPFVLSGRLAETLSEAVNEDFYRFTYGELPPGVTAAEHYASVGWRAGYDPNPWFSTSDYLRRHTDVTDTVPLHHFLLTYATNARAVAPSEHAPRFYARQADPPAAHCAPALPVFDDALAHQYEVVRAFFDAAYYLSINRDVADAGIDPLVHFVTEGWREGRDPNAFFSTKAYLDANVDVAEAGVNPFYHYLVTGRDEGRPTGREAGFRYAIIRDSLTLSERIDAVAPVDASRVEPAANLRRSFAERRRPGARGLHLTVSHDDFTANVGGLQICLQREAAAFMRRGADHVHFFPGRPLLVTTNEDDPVVGVVINGSNVGMFASSSISEVLGGEVERADWPEKTLAIHSLLGHNVKTLVRVFERIGLASGYFWVHDYASACAGLQLLRNDVEFCGAPPAESAACQICVYGERRERQVSDHEYLFKKLALTVVAPSASALATWKSATRLQAYAELVHPHCRLSAEDRSDPVRRTVDFGPLKIAYLGLPQTHKGWPVFWEILRRFGRDDRYAFYHLGRGAWPGLPLAFKEVTVTAGNLTAMTDAVRELNIDAALVWSPWPETFCLTAYEAVAGGAGVITTRSSGNVAKMVEETGNGIVFEDEAQLYRAIESGRLARLARSFRAANSGALVFSEMTADLVEAALV